MLAGTKTSVAALLLYVRRSEISFFRILVRCSDARGVFLPGLRTKGDCG